MVIPLPATTNVPTARSVSSERALQWLAEGWQLFIKAPGMWIGVTVVFLVASFAISLVPILGQLAINLFSPVVVAGLLIGCHALKQGKELRFDHLFAGFRQNTGNLIMVGVLWLAGCLAIALALFLVGGGAMVVSGVFGKSTGAGLALGSLLFIFLLTLALMIPLLMALWFAPALVVFGGMKPVDALKASFDGCLKNMGPFLIYGIVAFILLIVAMLPLALGLLVLVPVMTSSIYISYIDIYGEITTPDRNDSDAES